jgi:hypothetical protein
MKSLGSCALLALLALLGFACGDSSNAPSAAAGCTSNGCNQANGGGTCSAASGQAVCTCNAGFGGDRCATCAAGYALVGSACVAATCGTDSCNAASGGGTCAVSGGHVVCTCSAGYFGSECAACASGYHKAAGACEKDTSSVCAAAASGSSGPVQAPVLRQTLPGSWDENWLSSPAVADIDNDGKLEIIAARHSVLYVWNADGTLKWRTAWSYSASKSPEHGGSRMWASAVVGNFDSTPELEIAVGSDADSASNVNVAVYDYRGELLPGWPKKFTESEIRSITAGDIDADGTFEILVSSTAAKQVTAVFEIDGSMRQGWPQVNNATCDPPKPAEACWDTGGFNQNVGLGDVDGDGFLDVISSYDAIGFGVFDRDGKPFPTAAAFTADRVITSCEAYHDPALALRGWGTGDRSEFSYSPPVLADIDQNGTIDYVLVGDHEHSTSTANRGVSCWVLNRDMTRPAGWEWPKDTAMPLVNDSKGPNIVESQPSPSVGNIDQDPGLEILAPSYDGSFYAWSSTGALLWKYAFAKVASPYTGAGEALIADLNGDGVPEIVFTTYSSGQPNAPETPAHLVILNNNGVELFKIEISGRGSMAAPTLADLDGDGDLELVISLKDSLSGKSGAQIWDVPGSSTNCLLWATGRGGPLRQGYVPRRP